MSYQVLARKWRPRTFSELTGQGHVVTALSNALSRGQLHHAYLLTQPGSSRTHGAGVFAAGAVQPHTCRQAITAAGTGCMAAIDVERYLESLH